MSDAPTTPDGDTAASTTDEPGHDATLGAAERRRIHDLWVAGTEEPGGVRTATDEGAQQMLPRDLDPALALRPL